ncbi:PHD finger-like domain-containing protein 5A [Orbicella faveolata]|uniref:PHD finger-like domain-containing protein 5A n=1 Tax=Orbicella faveolata TaxID=48498 RepID=UPI0009E1D5BE|nr:PHD finger-like domain-containing protein 5A [Orbicella faveolata]
MKGSQCSISISSIFDTEARSSLPFFSLHLITYKNNNSNTHFITHLILLHSKKQEFALFTSWYSSFTGDGKCVICDSYVRPCTLVRICDECNYGSYQGRCVICGGPGVSDAYYCKECTVQEKDRDGCPKIVNLGSSKTDLFYERKKYGFKKR